MTDGPGIGEKIAHVGIGGAGGELIEHVAEVRPRVEAVPRRAGADAQQHGGGLQPAVAADVQPVGSADGQGTDGPLGGPVVDREPRVVEVTNERSPLIPGILDGLTEQALRRRVSDAALRASRRTVARIGPARVRLSRTTSASVNVSPSFSRSSLISRSTA